jgi:2-methylfumaryl-CoA isomerase
VMGHLGFIAEAQRGQPRERHGNELFGAFGRDFVTADGQRVMIVGLTLKQWRAICKAMQMSEAMDALAAQLGLDFAREGDRFRGRARIAEQVAIWFGARSLPEVAEAFDRCGVCWSRYQDIAELVGSDPECSPHNPMFSDIEQPGVGPLLAAGIPLDFGGIGRLPAQPAPRLGEHSEEVLTQLLGLDSAQFGRLHDKGVVGTAPA